MLLKIKTLYHSTQIRALKNRIANLICPIAADFIMKPVRLIYAPKSDPGPFDRQKLLKSALRVEMEYERQFYEYEKLSKWLHDGGEDKNQDGSYFYYHPVTRAIIFDPRVEDAKTVYFKRISQVLMDVKVIDFLYPDYQEQAHEFFALRHQIEDMTYRSCHHIFEYSDLISQQVNRACKDMCDVLNLTAQKNAELQYLMKQENFTNKITPLLSGIDNKEATEEAFKFLILFIDTFQKQVPLEIVSEGISGVSKVGMFAHTQEVIPGGDASLKSSP